MLDSGKVSRRAVGQEATGLDRSGAIRRTAAMTGFAGQIVIVTGAASGIGLGIAQAFHRAGARVVLGDVRQDALDQAQATFTDQARLAFVQVDVRDQASVAQLVAAAERAFGPPSVMIANAG